MANVRDISGNYPDNAGGVDPKLSSPNRSAATVSGTLTPLYVGEIVTDKTLGVNMRGTSTSSNTSWVVENRVLI